MSFIVFSYDSEYSEYTKCFNDEHEAYEYFKAYSKVFPQAGFIFAHDFDGTGYRVLISKDKNIPVLRKLKRVPTEMDITRVMSIFNKCNGYQAKGNTLDDI